MAASLESSTSTVTVVSSSLPMGAARMEAPLDRAVMLGEDSHGDVFSDRGDGKEGVSRVGRLCLHVLELEVILGAVS